MFKPKSKSTAKRAFGNT